MLNNFFFSDNPAVAGEIMWEDMAQPDRSQITV